MTEPEKQSRPTTANTHDEADIEPFGDPACWLGRVCAECGAMVEGVGATPCWRCGTVLGQEDAE